jgi:hypothetical protein
MDCAPEPLLLSRASTSTMCQTPASAIPATLLAEGRSRQQWWESRSYRLSWLIGRVLASCSARTARESRQDLADAYFPMAKQ